jgi:hypothetical protein
MFTWKKLGKIFSPQNVNNRPWLKEFAQAPASLILDDRVRMYFSCRPPADSQGQYVSYSAFVDLERSNLLTILDIAQKPVLELGQAGCFDEFGIYPVSVIQDGQITRLYYGGWTRCASVPFNVAIGEAVSTDHGLSFTRSGQGPVLSFSLDEPFVVSGPKIRKFNNNFYLFYIAGRKWKLVEQKPEPVYKIRLAISEDGRQWQKVNKDLIESRLEEDEAQASPDVFYANDKYHMFFSYRYSSDFRNKARGYRIGYATSTDLIHWQRADHKAGIDVSADGWDSEMVCYPHVFKVDEKIYMAYLGNQVGKEGFGLAILEGKLE